MTIIHWIQSGEKVVGAGHISLDDVANRPLRELLTNSGFDPDADNITLSNGLITAHTGTNPITLATRFGRVLTPLDFGAVGNGVADDTVAVQALFTELEGRGAGDAFLPSGYSFLTTAPIRVGGFTTINAGGLFNSKFIKAHTGDCLQIAGNCVHLRGVYIEAATGLSTTFGTQGVAVNFNVASTGSDCTWFGGGTYGCDNALAFAQDAGHVFNAVGLKFYPYNVAIGADSPTVIQGVPDTSAAFRYFTACHVLGGIDIPGWLDTFWTGCGLRYVTDTAATQIMNYTGCVFALGGVLMEIRGQVVAISGGRASGDITLISGSGGHIMGMYFTHGGTGLTNQAGNNWEIYGVNSHPAVCHKAIASQYTTQGETALVNGISASAGNWHSVTLTAARKVGNPTGATTGQRLMFEFIQGGAGGYAVTWDTLFAHAWSNAGNTVGKRSSIAFLYNGNVWVQDGAQSPYY